MYCKKKTQHSHKVISKAQIAEICKSRKTTVKRSLTQSKLFRLAWLSVYKSREKKSPPPRLRALMVLKVRSNGQKFRGYCLCWLVRGFTWTVMSRHGPPHRLKSQVRQAQLDPCQLGVEASTPMFNNFGFWILGPVRDRF